MAVRRAILQHMIHIAHFIIGHHVVEYASIREYLADRNMDQEYAWGTDRCSNTRQKGRSSVNLSQVTGMSVSTQNMPELVVARYYQSRRLSHAFYTVHAQVRMVFLPSTDGARGILRRISLARTLHVYIRSCARSISENTHARNGTRDS